MGGSLVDFWVVFWGVVAVGLVVVVLVRGGSALRGLVRDVGAMRAGPPTPLQLRRTT